MKDKKKIPKVNFVQQATIATLKDLDESLKIETNNWQLLQSYSPLMTSLSEELKTSSIQLREKYYYNYLWFHFLFVPFLSLFLTAKQSFGYGSLTIYMIRNYMPNSEINFLMQEPQTMLQSIKYKALFSTISLRYFSSLLNSIQKVTHIYE